VVVNSSSPNSGVSVYFAGLGCVLALAGALQASAQMTDVLTYHNDNARTGQALREEILTPANVNSNQFGKLRVLATDGKVDAQPLYAAGLAIPGKGQRNVLFVATEHDSVYAFDADTGETLWQVSLLASGETPSDSRGCGQVSPEIGITATPVIDRAAGGNGTLFAVAMSKKSGQYFQRLHALDLSTGADTLTPATVTAQYPGTGDNSSGGMVRFDPKQYKERPGMLLMNGMIYLGWSSHCDIRPYTGWLMAYDERTLAQVSIWDFTPNGNEGSIWMSGAGLAADAESNIYFLAANGTFDTTLDANGFPSKHDFGNAFLKVSTSSNSLTPVDYFATFNTPSENSSDEDLGSGGALVLPDMLDAQGIPRQLAVGAGKDQNIYLVDRTNMGKFNPANNNAIYQEVRGALLGGVFSAPAYFNGMLYYGAVSDHIKAFPFVNARLGTTSSETRNTFTYPGATPSVSANGTANGILWATENTAAAVLHAYNATNLAVELYNSSQAPNSRDTFGEGNKFITPTIASARVYVGTTTGVGVFSLLDNSSLTPLQNWRDRNFHNPSNVGAGANGAAPAGDAVPNLVKYALGLDPLQPAQSGQLPQVSVQTFAGQPYLTLTVNRAAIAPDVTYQVQVSPDLQTWLSGTTNTVTLTNTATQLIVRDTTPVSSAPRRFMRLAVTNP
jgi:outer membrane protein assembly factor BamB